AGALRRQLADLQTGDRRGDRLEFSAALGGRIRLQVDRVEVWRTTIKMDVDDRLAGTPFACGGLRTEHVGQRQSAQPQGPGREKVPAGDAAAVAGGGFARGGK